MKISSFALAVALGLLCGCSCPFKKADTPTAVKFNVRNVYGSHMVLQRGKPIRIAGSAEPGAVIQVVMAAEKNAAEQPVSALAEADEKGAWSAELPAKKAGGPYTVTVSGGKGSKPVVLNDVLVGDVWVCSGQSNMEMPVWNANPRYSEEDGDKIAKQANDPQLRLFKVAKAMEISGPLADLRNPGSWQAATTPQAVEPFSATGYFFGVALRKELGVPVGLIDTSWGGTMIQPWIPYEAYVKAKRSEVVLIDEARKTASGVNEEKEKVKPLPFKEWCAEMDKQMAPGLAKRVKAWTSVNAPAQGWKAVKGDSLFIVNHLGTGWFRIEFELPQEFDTKGVKLTIGIIDDCDDAFVNGVKVGSTDIRTKNYWQVERNYPIPAGLLKPGKNIIVLRVVNNNASGGIDGAVELCGKTVFDLRHNAKWSYRRGFVVGKALEMKHPSYARNNNKVQFPTVLYNAMVAPFTAFPVKGVIWYQGCSNSGQHEGYLKLQKTWVDGWRKAWGQDDLPFVITQLSSYIQGRAVPFTEEELMKRSPTQNPGFAPLRDTQKKMLSSKVGVAVTIDLGNAADIHPHNKKEFAPRLLAEALRVAYGRKGVSYGPLFTSVKREGDTLRIHFRKSASPLVTKDGKAPRGFAVMGTDEKGVTVTVWADAKIEKNSIVLRYSPVKEPEVVLYAWKDYPLHLNLYNQAGFPAFPFKANVPKKK